MAKYSFTSINYGQIANFSSHMQHITVYTRFVCGEVYASKSSSSVHPNLINIHWYLPSQVLDGDVVGLVTVRPFTRAFNGFSEPRSSIRNWFQPQEVKSIEEHKGVSLCDGAVLMVEGSICVLCAVG